MPPAFRLSLMLVGALAAGSPVTAQEFVGSEACRSCHQQEFEAWQGSHHQQAMQAATAATVRGDFGDAEFEYGGVISRFFRRDGAFFVRTDGADGQLADFEITHTFGVYPLQQYLVTFPDGRLQALGIAWDSRPAEAGGQRWFHLYPGQDVGPGHELHWTGAQQNWNFMCADCHSTNLQKNYRPETDRFDTTWSEISVGCEACHGPGSRHLEWAAKAESERQGAANRGLGFSLDERAGVHWVMAEGEATARRGQPNETRREIEVCASCHSRRGIIREGAAREPSFLDHYLPALLSAGLYYDDGQIRDEVYVWGSFMQSRMHEAGVTCSDCHDPHTQGLRAPGDGVCAQCHRADTFAAPEHHHHPVSSAGARCAACHMPETTYMVVDPRRDHSLRIPRPDLAAGYGTPDACAQCHADRDAGWAAAQFAAWYPQPRAPFQAWAPAFSAARSGTPGAGQALAALITDDSVPAIARATATLELAPWLDPQTLPALRAALGDDSPLLRLAAVRALDRAPVGAALPLAAPLLQDDLLAVRTEAARVLAGASRTQMNAAGVELLDRSVQEYIATQQLHSDRVENLVNLGNLYAQAGDPREAEAYYNRALAADPGFVPAWINLADLYRAQGMNAPALETLRKGSRQQPESGALQHALGLALVRQKDSGPALEALASAARLEPDNARFAYVYGVALNSTGKTMEALAVLETAHQRQPADRAVLYALATINRDRGEQAQAREWVAKLLELDPADQQVRQLLDSLQGPD